MIVHFHILGAIFIMLALLHVGFPRYFKWRSELASLSMINRQMMHVHAFFVALVVLFIGILCLSSAEELMRTPLGHRICMLLGTFWTLRLVAQLFVYSPKLWKGMPFETTVHVMFSMLWVYAAGTFFLGAFDLHLP